MKPFRYEIDTINPYLFWFLGGIIFTYFLTPNWFRFDLSNTESSTKTPKLTFYPRISPQPILNIFYCLSYCFYLFYTPKIL